MEEMDPVVRVDFVPAGLLAVILATVGGGFAVPERLCLAVGSAFLTPSDTEARGRVAVPDDFTDAADPVGDTAERAVGACFAAAGLAEVEDDKDALVDVAVSLGVDEESGALTGALDADADKDGLKRGGAVTFDGAREALRVRPVVDAPVVDAPVAGALVAGAVLVGLEIGALTDFLSAEVADAALFVKEVATSVATLVVGTFLTLPAPNVPDLRTYDQVRVKGMIGAVILHLPS